MRILFWVGYQILEFDSNTSSGLGGTELATINVAKNLVHLGCKVVVSGDVKNSGVIDGIEWIHGSELHNKYFNQFDVIVGVSYIHVIPEFEAYDAKKIYWAHNTEPFPGWRGESIQDETIREYLTKGTGHLDDVICLTEWHANQWSHEFNWQNPTILGNGINTSTFTKTSSKVKDSFIWSSAVDRGLDDLLQNWPRIKESLPFATLNVYWPLYSNEYPPMEWIRSNKDRLIGLGVNFNGPVSQSELHIAMSKSEYWCYLTDYEETYCITALEMQYSGVIPIVTPVAALAETVNSGIIIENDETKWDNLIKQLEGLSSNKKNKLKKQAINWAKQQTWFLRSLEWINYLRQL